ncbi:MAG: TetR/AcrR family transcriptional regulator [Christensenella sp.]|nr:TetR/AcrR family transcriptional regulator [Christensenella sp.]
MAENQTKKKIKEIAIELFREKGFENVTLGEICQKSGINKHTFYYYFKSKDDLLKDFYHFPRDIGMEYFIQILNAPNYAEQLWLSYKPFLDHIIACGIEIQRQLFIKNIIHDVGTFQEAPPHIEHIKMQAGIIQKGQEAKEIQNSSDPLVLCRLMHQIFISTLLMWCIRNGEFDLRAFTRASIESMLDIKPELRAYPDFMPDEFRFNQKCSQE